MSLKAPEGCIGEVIALRSMIQEPSMYISSPYSFSLSLYRNIIFRSTNSPSLPGRKAIPPPPALDKTPHTTAQHKNIQLWLWCPELTNPLDHKWSLINIPHGSNITWVLNSLNILEHKEKIAILHNGKHQTNLFTIIQNSDEIRIEGKGLTGGSEKKVSVDIQDRQEENKGLAPMDGVQTPFPNWHPLIRPINEAILRENSGRKPPDPRFFTPGIFVENKNFGASLIQEKRNKLGGYLVDWNSISEKFPTAKDARYGTIKGSTTSERLQGTCIFFQEEKNKKEKRK